MIWIILHLHLITHLLKQKCLKLNTCKQKLLLLKILFPILVMVSVLCHGLELTEISWVGLMMKSNKIYLNNVWRKRLQLNYKTHQLLLNILVCLMLLTKFMVTIKRHLKVLKAVKKLAEKLVEAVVASVAEAVVASAAVV